MRIIIIKRHQAIGATRLKMKRWLLCLLDTINLSKEKIDNKYIHANNASILKKSALYTLLLLFLLLLNILRSVIALSASSLSVQRLYTQDDNRIDRHTQNKQ
jgi:hypothetical protein